MLPSFEIHSGQCPSTVAGGISSPFQCWRLEEEHHKSERGDLWISPNLSTCEISQVARLGHWHLCGISTCYFSESFTRWRAIQHCQREGSLNHLQWFSKAISSTAITHRELHEEAGACHAGAWPWCPGRKNASRTCCQEKTTKARTQSGSPKVNGRKSTLQLLKPSSSKVKKMISLSKKRSKGCFGWRSLAIKFDAILKIKGGKKLSVETVRRMVRELGSR